MRIFLLLILCSVCQCADVPVLKIVHRCYWSGVQTYTIYGDGHYDLDERAEFKRGRTALSHGKIEAGRLGSYVQLLKAVGFFEVSEESLSKDREAAHNGIGVSDSLAVTMTMWDGADSHEVSGNAIEIMAAHYAGSLAYAKLLHAKMVTDLLIGEISAQRPQAGAAVQPSMK